MLDLGCGPGTLAIPLSHHAGEVVAVDRDPGMLAEARTLAAEAGRTNIAFLEASAEELPRSLGPFRLATLGQSFHWMARDQVLERLSHLVADGGMLAFIAPPHGARSEPWWKSALAVVERYLGPRQRHPRADPEPENAPALLRSRCFHTLSARTFTHTIERDVVSIIGYVYSMSIAQRHRFADRAPAFEAELTDALLRLNPAGVFTEHIETEIVLAPKQAA